MTSPAVFDNLFIFDLANNHQGDLDHARRIIDGIAAVVERHGITGALKFQFRHLESLVHPESRDRKDVKHVPRFIETALQPDDYATLTEHIREAGLLTMSTPFDEPSVDLLADLDLDIIKVASCSATDWPLLEKIATVDKPVVVSTGGLNLNKIDRLVQFFSAGKPPFALMHCVALYPTPDDKLNLNQISLFRDRYPGIPIGWSTHENQDAAEPVQIAFAKGARLFERHVGQSTEKYQLNAYSSTPEQLDRWIGALRQAETMCGPAGRAPASLEETASLNSLKRGVYAKRELKTGETITREDVFFAMPFNDGQLESGLWRTGLVADRDYAANEGLAEGLASYDPDARAQIDQIMLQTWGMMHEARVAVSPGCTVELSHHYGLERFREFGCVLFDCVNRTYCKKIIVLLPRQKHPYHFHKRKEETFQLLHGDLEVELDGQTHQLAVGDTLLVKPSAWHKFHTLHGAIFEEVSTTHYNDDSFYEDERIAKFSRERRKTVIQ